MTSEAETIVRAFFDLGAADDFEGMRAYLDPDAVWYGTRGGLDQDQVIRGPDAWIEYVREVQAPWDRFEVEVEELLQAGDMVVALLLESAHARHGDLDVQNQTAVNIKVRQGKIVECRGYLDRDEALRAAGLTE